MGVFKRLRNVRLKGVLSADEQEEKTPRLPRPRPTPGTQPPRQPPPTPTTRPLGGTGVTRGTRTYRSPGGTPSTQRIHNPTHFR